MVGVTLFKGLKKQLADLQKPQTLHDLHNLAGRATHELVHEGFRRETDPYGVPWQATTRPNPVLRDTGALEDGIKWKADSRGLVFRTTGKANDYAAYHQHGTRPSTRARGKGGRFRSKKSTGKLKRAAVGITYIPGLPARKFLPDEGRMPAAYAARLQNDFRTYFRQKYGG